MQVLVSAVGASGKDFVGKNLLDLGKFDYRFGQNQNLASPKTSDLQQLWCLCYENLSCVETLYSSIV